MGNSRNKQNISVDGGHDYIRRCYQEMRKLEEEILHKLGVEK